MILKAVLVGIPVQGSLEGNVYLFFNDRRVDKLISEIKRHEHEKDKRAEKEEGKEGANSTEGKQTLPLFKFAPQACKQPQSLPGTISKDFGSSFL